MADVNVLIHRERVPAGAGAWQVRPPGLAGITPGFCLAYYAGVDGDVDGAINAHGYAGFSHTGPESSYAHCYYTEDGVGTASVRRGTHGSALAYLVRDGSIEELRVEGSTFVSGGLDCNVAVNTLRPIITFVFLYGSDLQVYQERVPGLASGDRTLNTGFTGNADNQLGFFHQPSTFGTPSTGAQDSNVSCSLGIACRSGVAGPAAGQGTISLSQWSGGASGAVYQFTTSGACAITHGSTGGVSSEWQVTDIQDNTWTLTLLRGSAQIGVYATIINTGDSQVWCELLDSPVVSPWVVNDPGFEPMVAGLIAGQKSTDSTSFQQGDTGIFGWSIGDATNQGIACLSSENGPSTMVTKNIQDNKFLSFLEDDGTQGWEQANPSDFTLESTGFRVDNITLPTGTTGAKKWLAWAIEGAPTGPVIHTGTGVLQAQDASVSGVGEVVAPLITGDGALQAQPAAVSGIGDLIGAIEGTGALQAQSASVSGVGAIVHAGTGALQAQDAAVVGVGEVGNVRTGTGTLQAGEATVSGVGDRASVGAGTLQAQAAAVSGVGVTEGLIAGTGALQAQSATVSGLGVLGRIGTGALQAQPATVTGVGFLLGETTLTPGDIAAIQEAVWSDPRAVQLLNQVNEIWQRRGLDSANPQTYDKAGKQIRVGGITIDLTGNANEVTQTRQP